MTQINPESHDLPPIETQKLKRRVRSGRFWLIPTLVAFLAGSFGGYFVGFNAHSQKMGHSSSDMAALMEQVNPAEGYVLETRFGDIGPQLIAAGAFKLSNFVSVYQRAGKPLDEEQVAVLERGSQSRVAFNGQNAYFLLNLFWALGLTNQNRVLENGPMVRNGRENVVNFASTGGWSLAARPIHELYSSAPIVPLTVEQQELLEEVAQVVFRPCCDNPTHFPDCNHGMAMLGLLELMASQGASVDEMFEAAKYANAYWYPRQTIELAAYFKVKQKEDFSKIDARQLVSQPYSSLSGFQNVHQWLATNGVLPQTPGGGSSCGV